MSRASTQGNATLYSLRYQRIFVLPCVCPLCLLSSVCISYYVYVRTYSRLYVPTVCMSRRCMSLHVYIPACARPGVPPCAYHHSMYNYLVCTTPPCVCPTVCISLHVYVPTVFISPACVCSLHVYVLSSPCMSDRMYVLEKFEAEVLFSIKREITTVAIELVVLDERTA